MSAKQREALRPHWVIAGYCFQNWIAAKKYEFFFIRVL